MTGRAALCPPAQCGGTPSPPPSRTRRSRSSQSSAPRPRLCSRRAWGSTRVEARAGSPRRILRRFLQRLTGLRYLQSREVGGAPTQTAPAVMTRLTWTARRLRDTVSQLRVSRGQCLAGGRGCRSTRASAQWQWAEASPEVRETRERPERLTRGRRAPSLCTAATTAEATPGLKWVFPWDNQRAKTWQWTLPTCLPRSWGWQRSVIRRIRSKGKESPQRELWAQTPSRLWRALRLRRTRTSSTSCMMRAATNWRTRRTPGTRTPNTRQSPTGRCPRSSAATRRAPLPTSGQRAWARPWWRPSIITWAGARATPAQPPRPCLRGRCPPPQPRDRRAGGS